MQAEPKTKARRTKHEPITWTDTRKAEVSEILKAACNKVLKKAAELNSGDFIGAVSGAVQLATVVIPDVDQACFRKVVADCLDEGKRFAGLVSSLGCGIERGIPWICIGKSSKGHKDKTYICLSAIQAGPDMINVALVLHIAQVAGASKEELAKLKCKLT